MAVEKLSPRQKMISLMYLVFIAMLALNISKEVLTAFGIINERIIENNASLSKKNLSAFQQLELKSKEAPDQYEVIYKKAEIVNKATTRLVNYIEKIKTSLLANFDDPKAYEAMDQSSYLDERFFVGSKEYVVFLDEMELYRSSILEALEDKYPSLEKSINNVFNTKSKITDREGVKKKYIEYHFLGFPLVSSITKFTYLQNSAQTYQYDIFGQFLSGQLIRIASIDNYTTLLEQERTTYYDGDLYDGAIVLGRKDDNTKPNKVNISLGNRKLSKNDYDILDGKVKLKVRLGEPGDYKLQGSLIFSEDGKDVDVPVNAIISVISKPNSAVISADKMNVVYRGVDNPITISMPGVADNKIKATAIGLVRERGNYIMRPGKGREVRIRVEAQIDENTITSQKVFRIKDIPRPSGTISGQAGEIRLPKANLKISTIGAVLEDFDFDLKLQVKSFKMAIPGQPSISINSNKLGTKGRKVLNRAKRGDVVQVFDIKASILGNPTYKLKKIAPVLVRITN